MKTFKTEKCQKFACKHLLRLKDEFCEDLLQTSEERIIALQKKVDLQIHRAKLVHALKSEGIVLLARGKAEGKEIERTFPIVL
jgi:hypothetical protein